MSLMHTPACDFGWIAPDFRLPDPAGRLWTLAECAGPRGVLVMFLSNHCPYVQALLDRIVRDTAELRGLGVGSVAIMSNDVASYPSDGPAHMAELASGRGFSFPYLYDEDQSVARAYGAVCTPDFFGFNAEMGLQYRGRLDASGRFPAPVGARRELFEAMLQVAETGSGPAEQQISQGCSIKWR
jgi:peroxiredoxin